MTATRAIAHPGRPAPQRICSVEAGIHKLSLHLRKGLSLNEATTRALRKAGFRSGYVYLKEAALDPLRYVIPAPSPDGSHAAWYSRTYAPDSVAIVEQAGIVVGLRDGAPFIHCHGLLRLADGTRRMGHLLPFDSFLVKDVEVEAWGAAGAFFDVADDPETRFRLFTPAAQKVFSPADGSARGFLYTVRPNEDITRALEEACRRYGFTRASIHGIGSLVGADFAGGAQIVSYATEVLVTRGTFEMTADGPHCSLDIALVDMDGAVTEGRLLSGSNPVCVTFELLVSSKAIDSAF